MPKRVLQGVVVSDKNDKTVVVRVDGGFHWLDAGIGAVAALAVVLLAYGLTLSVGHSKGRRGT